MHKRTSDDLIMQSMPKVRKNSAICNGTPLYLDLSQKYSMCEKGHKPDIVIDLNPKYLFQMHVQ